MSGEAQAAFLQALEAFTDETRNRPPFAGQKQAVQALKRIAHLSVFYGRGK
jgi:hypothetical protein